MPTGLTDISVSSRHDAPTPLTPTSTLSVPSAFASPLPHILSMIATPSLTPRTLTVRKLVGDESPTSQTFVADAGASMQQREGALVNKCAELTSSL